ncbi:MAG: aldo/keto reductase, partial [Conexivisphaerales archaeon]
MNNFGSFGNGLVGISINRNKFAANVQGALYAIRESIESGLPILDLRQSWLYPELVSRVKDLLCEVKNRNVVVSAQVTRIYPGFEEVVKQVDTIRNRLGLSRLDILEVGAPFILVNLRETLKAVERLYIDEIIGGFSLVEIKAKHIKLFNELNLNAKLEYIKLGVSVSRPLIDPDIRKQVMRLNIPIFSTAPLEGGKLAENNLNGRLFRRLNGKLYKALDQISKSRNLSFAQISLAWLNSKGIISAPSTTSPNHAFENINSKSLKLTEHE